MGTDYRILGGVIDGYKPMLSQHSEGTAELALVQRPGAHKTDNFMRSMLRNLLSSFYVHTWSVRPPCHSRVRVHAAKIKHMKMFTAL